MPRRSMNPEDFIVFVNQAATLPDDEWERVNRCRNRIREKKVGAKKTAPRKPKPEAQP